MTRLGPLQWLGIAVLLAYGLWLPFFFGRVRPWLMAKAGRRLGVTLEEEQDGEGAGLFAPAGREASFGSQSLAWLADLAVLLLGTVGVAALVFVPAFLIADSGALLPLEARLTGRLVTFELPPTVGMRASQGTASLSATVRNDGPGAERQCQLRLAGYSARNGYLSGDSALFDLAPAQQRRVELRLRAMQPPVGVHALRVQLECANQRLLARGVSLRVVP